MIPEGTHAGGAHMGGPQGAIVPHVGGAQAGGAHGGGAQKFGRNMGSFGAGAKIPAIIAEGIPIKAPQQLVHAPSTAPHMPKGDGGPIGPHVGGAQGCGTGAQKGAISVGGPPAIPEIIETDNKSVVRNAKIATTLSAIPDPPFLTPFK